MSNETTTVIIAVTTVRAGAVMVPVERARALALALATGDHPWRQEKKGCGPLSLPDDPGSLEAAIAAAGTDDEGAFWRPNVTLDDDGNVVWRPWSGQQGRFIRISPEGKIRFQTGSGSGKGSTFLGGVLVAAAGGLSALHGVVKMKQRKIAA
ncbi:MAG: hypothetical protein O3B64_03500 [bacterium]|nr:hypothetical protein [bacterium]